MDGSTRATRVGPLRRRWREGLDDADEAALLAAAAGGDDDALQALYRRSVAAARRFVAVRARGRVDPQEVVDVVFTSIFLALRSGSGPREALGPYLRTALRNELSRQLQAAAHPRAVPLPDDLEGAAEVPVPRHLEDPVLRAALEGLCARHRRVVEALELQGRTTEELADELGISRAAAAALTYRARNALRAAYLQLRAGEADREVA